MISFYGAFFLLAICGGLLLAISMGGNDVANAMASAVGSKALTIKWALIIAAVMNITGAFFLGGEVCATITNGIVNPEYITDPKWLTIGMFSALLTAGVWVLLSTIFGLPVSSTHSIVGGVLGMGLVAAGSQRMEAIHWHSLVGIAISWVISPILAGIFAYVMYGLIRITVIGRPDRVKAIRRAGPLFISFTAGLISTALIFHTPAGEKLTHLHMDVAVSLIAVIFILAWVAGRVLVARILTDSQHGDHKLPKDEKVFQKMQIITSAYVALSQGANDVANAMGPVAALYLLSRYHMLPSNPSMPGWLLLIGGIGIALGIAFLGRRVIQTIGSQITELNNPKGYSVDFSVATTVLIASLLGIPVSSSTCAVGAITGTGMSHGWRNVNIRMLVKIFMMWVITLPVAAGTSALIFVILRAVIL